LPCGERTFLEAKRLRDHLTSLEFDNNRKCLRRQRRKKGVKVTKRTIIAENGKRNRQGEFPIQAWQEESCEYPWWQETGK